MAAQGPVQIAERVYWVGTRLPDDRFQSHPYLIVNGSDSVLIDPGSVLTIDETLRSVADLIAVSDIRWIVAHHADPDVVGALGVLSNAITRPDARIVTEWRAAALLKHYGHRFEYYLVEENDWTLDLGADDHLEFQLTPYLHFPGAMVSFDTRTRTLFSADIFGGFVPDSAILVSSDVDYIIDSARPFHQHYMPSRELLEAGLGRIQHRWPRIDRIAPQHGHVVDTPAVQGVFDALKRVDCGVFALADADLDLNRLLRISQARTQINDALLVVTEPPALLRAVDQILRATQVTRGCALFIDLPDQGWTMWTADSDRSTRTMPDPGWLSIDLPGSPPAVLAIRTADGAPIDPDLIDMLSGLAESVRVAVDHFLRERRQSRRVADLRRAALTDSLTGLANRRALAESTPVGSYALIALDLDHFKRVNDEFGHAAGDVVLRRFAAAIEGAIRDEDHAYRVGGEEFLIVLPETDEAAAAVVADRIGQAVRALDLRGYAPSGHATVSMGISCRSGAVVDDFPAAAQDADEALYAAKSGGRDRTVIHHGAGVR